DDALILLAAWVDQVVAALAGVLTQPSVVQVFNIQGSVVTQDGEYFTKQVRQYTSESGDDLIDPGSEQYQRIVDDVLARTAAGPA
ncbi:MAG: hypothetical protein AAFU65_18190, partial [Pseudomonadota bacterium]